MDLIKQLHWRYAVKKFSAQKLPDEKVERLLTALELAPSSYGLQPFRILNIRDPELRKRLIDVSNGKDKVAIASHLLVFAAESDVGDATIEAYVERLRAIRGETPEQTAGMEAHVKKLFASRSPEEKLQWAMKQTYLALGLLLMAAAQEGVDACPMEGINPAGYDEVLGLPEKNLRCAVVCALGYRAPDDPFQKSAKVRKPRGELIWDV